MTDRQYLKRRIIELSMVIQSLRNEKNEIDAKISMLNLEIEAMEMQLNNTKRK